MEFIDVSNVNDHSIDWKAVKAAGIKGVWLKATEGLTYDDSMYLRHKKAARAAGLHVGAYHFARPDRNGPVDEARHFCRIIGKPGRTDLKPVLDLEKVVYKVPKPDLERWSRAFNHAVAARIDQIPAFYSYPAYIDGLDTEAPIGNGLWLASYGPNDGKRHSVVVPEPWKRYIAHQYTSNGHVPGIDGVIDRSYVPWHRLNGVLAHPVLNALTGSWTAKAV